MEAKEGSLSPRFRFKDGTAKNSARVPKAKWDEHKEPLCSLYSEMTISDILAFMRAGHGFVANAGQLGRKLREWGVYKYDSKNRPSDTALRLYHDGLDEAFGEPFPQAVLENLSISKDLPVQTAFASDLSTAHTELLQNADVEHYMSYAGLLKTLPDPDEAHSTFDELPEPLEPTEYNEAYLTYTALHNSPPAAIAASNNPTTSINTPQHVKAHEEDVASSVPATAVVTKEPENVRLSDIDMDRFSSLSFTPSVSSGFVSLRSLA